MMASSGIEIVCGVYEEFLLGYRLKASKNVSFIKLA
jgi:hypothetical protein